MRRAALAVALVAPLACGVDGIVLRGAATTTGDAGAIDAGADAPPAQGDAFGVFSGQSFSCQLLAGAARCWGNNVEGALGTGDRQNALVPTKVAGGLAFDALALGEAHACGLEHATGRILCWGYDANGQLGQGDTTARLAPTPVVLPAAASRVTVGYDHSCAVLADGSLYCWGANAEGQLGQGDMPGAADALVPVRVGTASDWVFASGGQGHTCGVRRAGAAARGTMWCWGRNTAGELGQGSGAPIQLRAPVQVGTFEDWTVVDVGQDEACGLRADATLWCWGDGDAGELVGGAGAQPLLLPTQVGTDADWAAVSVDVFETCAVKQSGALYCWGRNVEGQLGVGDTTDRATPTAAGVGTAWASVSVGRFHMCAESAAHIVSCAGANDTGQLGQNDLKRRDALTPVVSAP